MGVSIYRFGIVYWGFRNLLIDLFVMNLIGRDCDGAVVDHDRLQCVMNVSRNVCQMALSAIFPVFD